jgi:FtsP/CotA-like multicopper oxidase with cupredoxin domain
MNMKNAILKTRLLLAGVLALTSLAATAHAAAPGISGPTFNLTAAPAYLTQPDGQAIYSWGYGCAAASSTVPAPTFAPATITTGFCNTMQVPGPTLIVTEGQTVSVTLTNSLPTAAGNTSILFPGFNLTSTCPAGQQGLLTCEAAPGGSVTYTFTASTPGTRAYYSGTQSDLQVEMGLYGAVIVLPASPVSGDPRSTSTCAKTYQTRNKIAHAQRTTRHFKQTTHA